MTYVARALFVAVCCFFVSGTTLKAAKPERNLEPNKVIDITESRPAAAAAATQEPGALDKAAASSAKKKGAQPPKGIVYLPLVSLSSYVPIGAQILMMLLMIATSGLFGAWLMFRELAKRVQILQESMPVLATPTQQPGEALMKELLRSDEAVSLSQVNQTVQAPVKKRTLFVSSKHMDVKNTQSIVEQHLSSSDHESNRLEYTPPKAKSRRQAQKQSEDSKSNRMPKNFLINEWFPVER